MLNLSELKLDAMKTSERIVQFIRDEIEKSGLNGALVSVSGGIDSAVALALTVKALGSDRVKALTLPERDITPKRDIKDVMRLVRRLDEVGARHYQLPVGKKSPFTMLLMVGRLCEIIKI